jgi:hypothetical protein
MAGEHTGFPGRLQAQSPDTQQVVEKVAKGRLFKNVRMQGF